MGPDPVDKVRLAASGRNRPPGFRRPAVATREFQLEERLDPTLNSYARFIGSTPGQVVTSAIRFVFWKDKEFDRL